jgi:hypothetical protein
MPGVTWGLPGAGQLGCTSIGMGDGPRLAYRTRTGTTADDACSTDRNHN